MALNWSLMFCTTGPNRLTEERSVSCSVTFSMSKSYDNISSDALEPLGGPSLYPVPGQYTWRHGDKYNAFLESGRASGIS